MSQAAVLAAVKQLSPAARAALRTGIETNLKRNRFAAMYPPGGPLSRANYPRHLAFFAAGAEHGERAFVAGNRTGKSTAAAYELTCHVTGRYPAWWVGRRFNRPITAWAVGVDAKSCRETVQVQLLGPPESPGTGMISLELLAGTTRKSGTAEAVDALTVRHVAGGLSRIVIKSAEQGRLAMQGAAVDAIWLDEEVPLSVYAECAMRTMATVPGERNGIIFLTFTPLMGLSEVVLLYLPGGKPP